MATEYFGIPEWNRTVTRPSDGDDGDAGSVNDGKEDAWDSIKYVRRALALTFVDHGTFTTAGTFTPGGFAAAGAHVAGSAASWFIVGPDDGTDAFIGSVSPLSGLGESANPKAFNLNAVVFDVGGAKWIFAGEADGSDAYLLTLEPGPIFIERVNPTAGAKNFGINALAQNGTGTVVGAGVHDGADIYAIRSVDAGVTWTEVSIPGGAGDVVNSIAWGGPALGRVFVAVGEASGGGPLIWTSPDGITWTVRTPATGIIDNINAVVWNGSVFVAVGDTSEIQTSVDGIVWTNVGPAPGPGSNDITQLATDGDGVLLARRAGPPSTIPLIVSFDDGVTFDEVKFSRGESVIAGAEWGFIIVLGFGTTLRVWKTLSSR